MFCFYTFLLYLLIYTITSFSFFLQKTEVSVVPYLIHRDAEYWENPHSFIPDRFSKENRKPGKDKFCYLPFSCGLRR